MEGKIISITVISLRLIAQPKVLTMILTYFHEFYDLIERKVLRSVYYRNDHVVALPSSEFQIEIGYRYEFEEGLTPQSLPKSIGLPHSSISVLTNAVVKTVPHHQIYFYRS